MKRQWLQIIGIISGNINVLHRSLKFILLIPFFRRQLAIIAHNLFCPKNKSTAFFFQALTSLPELYLHHRRTTAQVGFHCSPLKYLLATTNLMVSVISSLNDRKIPGADSIGIEVIKTLPKKLISYAYSHTILRQFFSTQKLYSMKLCAYKAVVRSQLAHGLTIWSCVPPSRFSGQVPTKRLSPLPRHLLQ